MHCSPPTRTAPAPTPAAEQLVTDGDRQIAADLLSTATVAGCLDLDELDRRLGDVWSARTGAALAATVSDVPPEVRRRHERACDEARARSAARQGLRGHVTAYVAVILLLVAVWAVSGLTGGGWYPWPLWPALGWGVCVARQVRVAGLPAGAP